MCKKAVVKAMALLLRTGRGPASVMDPSALEPAAGRIAAVGIGPAVFKSAVGTGPAAGLGPAAFVPSRSVEPAGSRLGANVVQQGCGQNACSMRGIDKVGCC